ncbi:hypothetical protein BB561_000159 [Smittium simulii]|uniref:Uncharacterized protein n=1 Tax=Smittium simulii TaxID=133385 RepID=A0A2T9Z080_9FUNG|nr:hypothetical protein BB561_000159 [Smittium simulii]
METKTSPLIKPELNSNSPSNKNISNIRVISESQSVTVSSISQIHHNNRYQLNNSNSSSPRVNSLSNDHLSSAFPSIKREPDSQVFANNKDNFQLINDMAENRKSRFLSKSIKHASSSPSIFENSNSKINDNVSSGTQTDSDTLESSTNYSFQKNHDFSANKIRSYKTPQLDVLAYVTINTPPISRVSKDPLYSSNQITPYKSRKSSISHYKNIKSSNPDCYQPASNTNSSLKSEYNHETESKPYDINSEKSSLHTLNNGYKHENSSDCTQSEDEESWQRRSSKAKRIAFNVANVQSPCQQASISKNNPRVELTTPNRKNLHSSKDSPFSSSTPLLNQSSNITIQNASSPFVENATSNYIKSTSNHSHILKLPSLERNRSTLESINSESSTHNSYYQSKTPLRFNHNDKRPQHNTKAPNTTFVSRSSYNYPLAAPISSFQSNYNPSPIPNSKNCSNFDESKLYSSLNNQHKTPNKKKVSKKCSNQSNGGETTETDEETVSLPPFSPIFYTSKKSFLSNRYPNNHHDYPNSERIYRKAYKNIEDPHELSQVQSPTPNLSHKIRNKRKQNTASISNNPNFSFKDHNETVYEKHFDGFTTSPHLHNLQRSDPNNTKVQITRSSRQHPSSDKFYEFDQQFNQNSNSLKKPLDYENYTCREHDSPVANKNTSRKLEKYSINSNDNRETQFHKIHSPINLNNQFLTTNSTTASSSSADLISYSKNTFEKNDGDTTETDEDITFAKPLQSRLKTTNKNTDHNGYNKNLMSLAKGAAELADENSCSLNGATPIKNESLKSLVETIPIAENQTMSVDTCKEPYLASNPHFVSDIKNSQKRPHSGSLYSHKNYKSNTFTDTNSSSTPSALDLTDIQNHSKKKLFSGNTSPLITDNKDNRILEVPPEVNKTKSLCSIPQDPKINNVLDSAQNYSANKDKLAIKSPIIAENDLKTLCGVIAESSNCNDLNLANDNSISLEIKKTNKESAYTQDKAQEKIRSTENTDNRQLGLYNDNKNLDQIENSLNNIDDSKKTCKLSNQSPQISNRKLNHQIEKSTLKTVPNEQFFESQNNPFC